jgi:hypothetical protein
MWEVEVRDSCKNGTTFTSYLYYGLRHFNVTTMEKLNAHMTCHITSFFGSDYHYEGIIRQDDKEISFTTRNDIFTYDNALAPGYSYLGDNLYLLERVLTPLRNEKFMLDKKKRIWNRMSEFIQRCGKFSRDSRIERVRRKFGFLESVWVYNRYAFELQGDEAYLKPDAYKAYKRCAHTSHKNFRKLTPSTKKWYDKQYELYKQKTPYRGLLDRV